MASNNSGVWNEAGASFDFSIAPGVLSDPLVPGVVRGRFSGVAVGAVPVPAPSDRARIQRAPGRTRRRAHPHRARSARHAAAEFSGADAPPSGGGRLASPGKSQGSNSNKASNARIRRSPRAGSAVHDLRSSATITNDLAQAVRALGEELAAEDGRGVPPGGGRPVAGSAPDHSGRDLPHRSRGAAQCFQPRPGAPYRSGDYLRGERLFRLRIRDDGQGIAPEILEEGRPGHYGLPGMRERARQIGAKLKIWSGVGSRHGNRFEHRRLDCLRNVDRAAPACGLFRKKAG